MTHYLFQHQGAEVVFLGRFVLVLRSFAGLLAGAGGCRPTRSSPSTPPAAWSGPPPTGSPPTRPGCTVEKLSGWLAAAFGVVAVAVAGGGRVLMTRRHAKRLEARAEVAYPGPLPGYPGGAEPSSFDAATRTAH